VSLFRSNQSLIMVGLVFCEHGWRLGTQVGGAGPGNPCWYNSITYAISTDGGLSFTHATPPGHVVAPPWEKWGASTGTPTPYGYFFPSNIVLGPDNAYYSFFSLGPELGMNLSGSLIHRPVSLEHH
jgi:hypothetical protein